MTTRILPAAIVVAALAAFSAESLEVQLQRAVQKEAATGDLKAAIEGYKKIASSAGPNHAVAAEALLHLGDAQRRQGDAQARATYERIVKEFSGETKTVAVARQRLEAFHGPDKGPTLRQICSWDCWARISGDGRWSLYQRTDGIGIRDNTTGGAMRTLVEGAACCMRFSPDNTRIAYATQSPSQTFVINVDGSGKHMVGPSGWPMAWSPDGSRLLMHQNQGDLDRLAWVRVADGTLQQTSFQKRNLDTAMVSPDGRWIAVNASPDANSKENVFLIRADGSGESRVSQSPLYQEPVSWSSDGSRLFFSQTETSPSLWAVPIANGGVQGPAISLRQFNTGVQFLALTATGTLYYRELVNGGDVYTASMDPVGGKVTSIPVAVPLATTSAAPMVWSPDSKRMAHFSGAPPREIHVFTAEDGKDVRVAMGAAAVNSLCWPRGTNTILTNILTPATSSPNRTPARLDPIRVDLTTGESQQVFPGASSFRLWDCTDTLAANFDSTTVKIRNIQTGAETSLYQIKRPTVNYGMSRISPDGRAVAFLELLDSDTVVLLTVPTAGGPPRELTRANAPIHLQEVDGHSWSHDSRYVYFFRRASANAPYEMFRVPASGGAEENMGLQNMELRDLHFSPDGTKISFSNGAFQRPEIWAMDNFLPANK